MMKKERKEPEIRAERISETEETETISVNDTGSKWDVFIAHASEDKNSFVRPLATALQNLGVTVW
jgi:hypothetical protein